MVTLAKELCYDHITVTILGTEWQTWVAVETHCFLSSVIWPEQLFFNISVNMRKLENPNILPK